VRTDPHTGDYTDKDGIHHKLTTMPNGDTIDVWDGKDHPVQRVNSGV
jgi:hypothetical protein